MQNYDIALARSTLIFSSRTFYSCRYKDAFTRLRSLKTEIEHLQHLLERSKVKLMKDFELWWAKQAAAAQVYGHYEKLFIN